MPKSEQEFMELKQQLAEVKEKSESLGEELQSLTDEELKEVTGGSISEFMLFMTASSPPGPFFMPSGPPLPHPFPFTGTSPAFPGMVAAVSPANTQTPGMAYPAVRPPYTVPKSKRMICLQQRCTEEKPGPAAR